MLYVVLIGGIVWPTAAAFNMPDLLVMLFYYLRCEQYRNVIYAQIEHFSCPTIMKKKNRALVIVVSDVNV